MGDWKNFEYFHPLSHILVQENLKAGGRVMARGVRKPIEEKIREKKEVIESLKRRIQKENEELEELIKEERERNLEALSAFLSEVNLSPEEAAEILRDKLQQDEVA